MAKTEIRRTSRLLLMDGYNKILLGQRVFTSQQRPGQLDIFGGSVNPGEPASYAAVREQFEETGINIGERRVAHLLRRRDRDGRFTFLRDYYVSRIEGSFDEHRLRLSENLGAVALSLEDAYHALRWEPHQEAVVRASRALPDVELVA